MTKDEKKIKKAIKLIQDAYNILLPFINDNDKMIQLKSIGEDDTSLFILDVVRNTFEQDPLQKTRKEEVALARHAYRLLLRQETKRSLSSIGQITLNADHTTVISSINTALELYETKKDYKNLIEICRSEIQMHKESFNL